MEEPTAKHIIVTEANKEANPNFVDFWFLTDEAKQWLLEQIKKYSEERIIGGGEPYGLRENDKAPGKGWFVVNKCFDVNEVVEYLNSYGNE